MIGLMLVYVDVLFTFGDCGSNSLGSWSYSKEWEFRDTKYLYIHTFIREISVRWHSRNLILRIHCYRIITITVYSWPNG